MKRVLPIVILITIVETIGVIWLGFWLFSCKLYAIIAFSYIVSTALFIFSILFRFIALNDIYHSCREIGKRFEEYEAANFWPFTFIWAMGSIFNKIDSFDFTPTINQWKQFWGY